MTSLAGAVIVSDPKKTLVFKNRDLESRTQADTLFYDVDCFGIRGINMATGQLEGLAVGVNHYGLAAANTHVRQSPSPTYDILTEQILMFAKNTDDGLSMTIEHLKRGREYQWGNVVLADMDKLLVIEIAGSDYSIEWSERKVIRTGHHIMLDTEETLRSDTARGDDFYENSVRRFEQGYELLRNTVKPEAVFDMLSDHGEEAGQTSVCRHPDSNQLLSTVASYVIEMDHPNESGKPRILFHLAKGNPCSTAYSTVPIPFPADADTIERAKSILFK
ncbi:MAG: hypothetical protein JSW61_10430 [Candidatus Thorarchaeota archaeon]|nr:MAG: hypothetical protein JSW61_10430 [Candidatus Thorarchaeota archaeon]